MKSTYLFIILLYFYASLSMSADAMVNILYAPWRQGYGKSSEKRQEGPRQEECPFCNHLASNNDHQYYILKRFKYNVICLNTFPYKVGQLLIMPLMHHAQLDELDAIARFEFIELVSQTTKILQNVLHTDGINIGFNLGKVAGASIPSHLHVHIIPRHEGDTGFGELIARTTTLAHSLGEIFVILKPHIEKIVINYNGC